MKSLEGGNRRTGRRLARALSACLVPLALVAARCYEQGPSGSIIVHVDQPGHAISPMFYGVMTEEINHAYDGGLYGELIQNRALADDPNRAAHWTAVDGGAQGSLTLEHGRIRGTALESSLLLDIGNGSSTQWFGVANDGYWGIPVRPHTRYRGSLMARVDRGFRGSVTARLVNAKGDLLAQAKIGALTGAWKTYRYTLTTGTAEASSNNRLLIAVEGAGKVHLTEVSLFGPTFKNRPNGSRIDLMQLLGGMNPSFLRFPGGNYLEGDSIPERFDWRKTLGPISSRPGHLGPWGYRSTDGFGLVEFLDWCEDLHMAPVLAVYAGYSLRGEHVDAGPALEPYAKDAVDEIQFVVDHQTSHKLAPLTYVEIGNEDWFDASQSYDARFAQFYDAIKKRFPQLKLIATMPVKSRTPDVIDEHFYRSAEAMALDARHYDSYDRAGPKIFVGEWASTEGRPTPTLHAALGDAAWLTGLERNSDLVLMEAYAPLLVNVNPGAAQWGTNLIGYDALHSFGSPSYWVQSLFAKNTGNVTLPAEARVEVPKGASEIFHGKIGLRTYMTSAEYKDVQVTEGGKTLYAKDFSSGADDWTLGRGTWKAEEGVLRQTSDLRETWAAAGDPTWSDYTLHVRARKIGGSEGFFVLFHVHDDRNYWQWNIGGWRNTRSNLQHAEDGALEEVGASKDLTIETGRWYDLSVEAKGGRIRCYLDGKLIHDVPEAKPPLDPIYVAASRVTSSGDLILKVVNFSDEASSLQIDLQGAGAIGPVGSLWVIEGEPEAMNSIAEPEKIVPKESVLRGVGRTFQHKFPAHSVSVLRLKVAKGR